ncbi:MAG: sugar-binding protein [Oscillospiraceae bacterium]|nr:sugar-binding protein [Oscillospiraceae bacterium]
MKKLIALLLGLTLMLAMVAACADDAPPAGGSDAPPAGGGDAPPAGGGNDGGFIGIAMPTQSSQRWIDDGNNLVQQLEALGHRTILQYGEDVVADQVSQIENMIVQGVDILVIAAIDGGSLTGVLAQAAAAGITVIAYDRLIMDTEHVDYYTTFDNFAVGVLQATSILDGLGITDGETGPFNIELFGGSPDDNNAFFFYDGAMSILQPKIDDGTLVVKSGQMGMDVVGTLGWAAERAQERMDNLLTAYYATDRIDAVLSPYDGLSIGILSALRGVGYGSQQIWPIVSGQDAEVPSVQSIINGEQFSTVFKDTRVLAESTVNIIVAVLDGRPGPVNDTTTYHNNVKLVPSFLSQSVSVTIDNWYEALIETGYYTADQFTF